MCRGEIFFARTCAIDAQLTTRYDRAPATRHPPPHHGCTGEKYFARTCATHTPSPNHQTCSHHESWCTPNSPPHHGCTGEKYFAPTCANDFRSPNQQTSTCPKSWQPPNSPPHHGWTGEKYFAPTCAVDAPSPTRFDGAPAVRCRTTDVRAEYFSPGRTRLMRHRSHIGRQRATLRADDCVICRRAICWWRGRA